MGRDLNLTMSFKNRAGRLFRPAQLPSLVVVVTAMFAGFASPATAALTCGDRPEVSPADVAEQIKGDAKDKAGQIMQALTNVDLRKFVTGQRRAMRLKYPSADKAAMDHYLLWITCQTISDDRTTAGSQHFEDYSKVYRLLSEPLDKVDVHPE